MHIRPGFRNAAQTGSTESETIVFIPGDLGSSHVTIRDAQMVKLFITQKRTMMTRDTASLPSKQFESCFGVLGKCILVSHEETVER